MFFLINKIVLAFLASVVKKAPCFLYKELLLSFEYLSECVCAFNKVTHCPNCTYIQVVVENHNVSILVLLQ